MSFPSSRALSSGNSRSVRAAACSTVGRSNARSTAEKSHSSTYVTAGISRCARVRCSTIWRRTPRTGSRRPSDACGADAARTSSSVIRPPGPLAETDARSTPSSCAIRRTSGVACTRSGADGAPATAPSPITTSTAPTGATSPSATRIRVTFPAAGDGISTVVLSVWISTSGASSTISSPSATSHRATSPSVRPSPRSGNLNS